MRLISHMVPVNFTYGYGFKVVHSQNWNSQVFAIGPHWKLRGDNAKKVGIWTFFIFSQFLCWISFFSESPGTIVECVTVRLSICFFVPHIWLVDNLMPFTVSKLLKCYLTPPENPSRPIPFVAPQCLEIPQRYKSPKDCANLWCCDVILVKYSQQYNFPKNI